jgi:DNA-binding winged helix-turn-helix (wHTH) protein
MGGRFGDLVFDDSFLTATRAHDGVVVRFTRRERTLLKILASQPGRLFDRATLVEALGTRGSDRNVDFAVNRLRAKLGDTGPERRFISTQYGEGYVWIAQPAVAARRPAFFEVAMLRGSERGAAVADMLRKALSERLGAGHSVAADAPDARFRIEASLHAHAGELHVAIALRDGPSREVVATLHESFPAAAPPNLDGLAARLCTSAWKHVALPASAPAPTDPPLLLRLYAAAVLMDPSGAVLAANDAQITELRAAAPNDPSLAIAFAMQRLGRMVGGLEPTDDDSVAQQTLEIEALVLGALPAVRDDPMLALAAAKLLLATHRGHNALAEELASTAFAQSAAFAQAFPMLGQLRAAAGDLAQAVRFYDEGLALAEPGSVFEAYILVLKAQALVAADAWPGVEAIYDRLAAIVPGALIAYAPLFLPPGDEGLAQRLGPLVDQVPEAMARRMIRYQWHRSARYFRDPAHAANLMRGVVTHFVRRFGPGVVAETLWDQLPDELAHLRRQRKAAAE